MGKDTELMIETAAFLETFGVTKGQFVAFILGFETWNGNTFPSEPANYYHYFKGCPIPLTKLFVIGQVLLAFEIEFPEDDPRLEDYRSGAKQIYWKICDYIDSVQNGPFYLRQAFRTILRGMSEHEIDRLFSSLYVFSLPDRVWYFWACYYCLDYQAQEKVEQLMTGAKVTPKNYASKLTMLHMWEEETGQPFQMKYNKLRQTYRKSEDKNAAWMLYTKKLAALLEKYPFAIPNKASCFAERYSHPLNYDDWAILSTYSLLCSSIDLVEQKRLDETMLAYLSDSNNWRLIESSRGTMRKIPAQQVNYYERAFRDSNFLL